MNTILTLVDFTDTANIALEQSIALARRHKAKIIICHVVDSPTDKAAEATKEDLKAFQAQVEQEGLECELCIGHGNLFDEISSISKRTQPDLVVVGTHGKTGLWQNLFGSNIYKLVSKIPLPVLVVNDFTKVQPDGYKRVLLPVAPHPNYLLKVEQTCRVLGENGKVFIFEIRKPGAAFDEQMWKNMEATKNYLDECGVEWEYLEKGSLNFSLGYSHETLNYARESQMDLLSIMTSVSDKNKNFGKMDKENLLLNKSGMPVLCANA